MAGKQGGGGCLMVLAILIFLALLAAAVNYGHYAKSTGRLH